MSDQVRAQRLRKRYAAALEMGLHEEAEGLARRLGLSRAEVLSHRRAGTYNTASSMPDRFDEFATLPPGRFDARVFDQTTWWVDILRRPHRITERAQFTDGHLLAVLAFVQDQAWRWARFPELNDDDPVNEEWFLREATARIRQTPLFRALSAEAQLRGLLPPQT